MCTVVCRWDASEAFPVQMLALRDELLSRRFDPPGRWWPAQPDVIGGRDRTAGGSWCVSDVGRGVTAVVLNRPERRTAAPGAASRGVLPLLAVRHLGQWPEHLELAGMASFNLVLVSPDAAIHWWFDGSDLHRGELAAGTHMFTPRGLVSAGPADRWVDAKAYLGPEAGRATAAAWPDWLRLVRAEVPSGDSTDLIVHKPVGEDSYETVFGQFIAARPGLLRLDYLDHPARNLNGDWTPELWRSRQPASFGPPDVTQQSP